jgi:hypothetical protein
LSLDRETKRLTFEDQPDAILSQANPVQNQWYTVLDSKKECKVYAVTVLVWATGETLEVRVTIDGKVLTGSVNASATTYYYVHHQLYGSALIIDGNIFLIGHYSPLEGREVRVECRKTTNAGAGTLDARVVYAKR